MIVGIGLDVVELERVRNIVAQSHGAKFAQRVLTMQERVRWAELPDRRAIEYLAGRLAAKEAVVKALGCGIGAKVGFQDIEVLADDNGKPVCTLSSASWDRLQLDGGQHVIHVAITHERNLAAASCVVESIS